jgi:hypothetical protein
VTDLAASSASAVVPGVLGFLVVAALGIALFFLLRSMNKQLNKVITGPKWREQARNGQPGQAAASGGRQNGSAGTPVPPDAP